MNQIEILKKMVGIPSYLDKETNEIVLGHFVFELLSGISGLEVERQFVEGDRFNIYAYTSKTPKLLLSSHLDTVQPKDGWDSNYLEVIEKDKKIFGLGAADTKGGGACLLASLLEYDGVLPDGLGILFYIDEEYDFKGMKSFVESNNLEKLEVAVCTEPSDLKAWIANRGIVELSFKARGISGHAANPDNGVNAISKFYMAYNELLAYLKDFYNPLLKNTTVNLAFLQGGVKVSQDKDVVVFSKSGNNIADYIEGIIELRISNPELNDDLIKKVFTDFLQKNSLKEIEVNINHILRPLINDEKIFLQVVKNLSIAGRPIEILNPETIGYTDAEIIKSKKDCLAFAFGPIGGNLHSANEWVDIDSLEKTKIFFKDLIREVIGN